MWAKLDDDYLDNRKVRSVSALAQHLHVASILHCSKGETDGFYPKYDLALVAARARIESPTNSSASRFIKRNRPIRTTNGRLIYE